MCLHSIDNVWNLWCILYNLFWHTMASYWTDVPLSLIDSLLAGEHPPFSISCLQTLTVEHIFLHCVEFNNIRKKFFTVSTLNELFRDVNPTVVLQLLREAGLYKLF